MVKPARSLATLVGPKAGARAELRLRDPLGWAERAATEIADRIWSHLGAAVTLTRAVSLFLVSAVVDEQRATCLTWARHDAARVARCRQDSRVCLAVAPARASIVGLLARSGPAAVAWFVVAVVVDALERQSIWTPAHVCNEARERVPPFLADRDTASAVVVERLRAWVGATLNHRLPRVVLGAMCPQ